MAARRSKDSDDFEDEDDEYEYEEYEDEEDDSPAAPRASLFGPLTDASRRQAATVPLILILFGFGAWLMWSKYGTDVLAHPSFHLDPHQIEYTPPPKWLDRNVLDEVIRNGSLDVAKLHQTDLVVQVANAFELHPWVKRVERVRKQYPANLIVELTYRAPVAMVALPPRNGEYFLGPIDAEGVLLPDTDFNALTASQFPRVDVGNTEAIGGVGSRWGDPVVVEAARLAELLHSQWDILGEILFEIQLSSQPTSTNNVPDFDVVGRPDTPMGSGLRVRWGRAPGSEQAGEPTGANKLAELAKRLAQLKLAGPRESYEIDLRSVRVFSSAMRSNAPSPVEADEKLR